MSMHTTAEEHALVAAHDGDTDELRLILSKMLPVELAELKRAAERLALECENATFNSAPNAELTGDGLLRSPASGAAPLLDDGNGN